MKRRQFIQNASLGATSLIVSKGIQSNNQPVYNIPVLKEVNGLSDIVSKDGYILVRFEFMNPEKELAAYNDVKISVTNGNILRSRDFFFENKEVASDNKYNYKGIAGPGTPNIIVFWLDQFSELTEIKINRLRNKYKFNLKELIEKAEINISESDFRLSVNYLLDKETGVVDLNEIGVKEDSDEFRFSVLADPQGGDPDASGDLGTRLKIHNAWTEESLRLVNELQPVSKFSVIVGDIVDGQGPKEYFLKMEEFFKQLSTPVLYEIGNHESKYNALFGPGYSHESLRNYYEAQYRINGTSKLLYSFDYGQWHFIVWPDPLRSTFWERHPHYFDWLEKDLEMNREKPTMIFQHVPIQPIGIDPLIDYSESPYVKRLLLDIFSKYGNVKYVLSGHVHIPLRASIKTAMECNGIKFINLPAAGYRPRAFGEEDLYGGPTQGIAVIDIKGRDIEISFKSVTNEIYIYSDKFPEIKPDQYPLWLNFRWEIPKHKELQNGDFESGLENWIQMYYYKEDQNPSNLTLVQEKPDADGKALFLFNRKRGYDCPGQDRLPQAINRIAQAVMVPVAKEPVLEMQFMIDRSNYREGMPNGSYIWLEAYEKNIKRMNISYSVGYYLWNLERKYSQLQEVPSVRMEITSPPGIWHKLRLNPFLDFMNHSEMKVIEFEKIDRFIINLGVWTINDGFDQKAGVWFSDLKLNFKDYDKNNHSLINGNIINKKDDKYMWWGGFKHVAGEHQIWKEDMNWYGADKIYF